MTGYGRGQSDGEGCRVTVEIRSVNHRFLDLKLRGAALDAGSEDKLRQLINRSVSRGALTVSTRIDRRRAQTEQQIDYAAARRVYNQLRELAEVLGVDREISLAQVCSQPGVMVSPDIDESAGKRVGEVVLRATEGALEELVAMRLVEGTTLRSDVLARLQRLGAIAQKLQELAKSTPEEAQRRLQERIDRLLQHSKVEVDAARLAQEVAIAVDRLDVTEELVRVASHLEQIAELLEQSDPVGRRLDFLVQELGREFNTITSKSQSAEIARLVVEAKAGMEKIREQVQNIE